jgi:hypothetical protein
MFIRPAQTANSPLIISEFRLRGPGGPADEFIEIYNNTDEAHVVTASDGSSGYGVFASDGIMRFFIPNGTVILTRLAQRVWQTRYGQVQILRGDRTLPFCNSSTTCFSGSTQPAAAAKGDKPPKKDTTD